MQRIMGVSLFLSGTVGILLPTWAFAESRISPIFPAVFYLPVIFLLSLTVPIAVVVILVKIRWREISAPSSQKTLLHESDFRSIWDIAHLWAGYPRGDQSADVPEAVLDKL
jgi:hypothetical protein